MFKDCLLCNLVFSILVHTIHAGYFSSHFYYKIFNKKYYLLKMNSLNLSSIFFTKKMILWNVSPCFITSAIVSLEKTCLAVILLENHCDMQQRSKKLWKICQNQITIDIKLSQKFSEKCTTNVVHKIAVF
jgi:hypothetical protein